MRPSYYFLLILIIAMLTACTNVTSYHIRDGALRDLGNIVVIHNVGDEQHLENQISDDLQQRGFNAVAGGATNIPSDADTLFYYVPYWVEGEHNHTLHIHVHDAHTHQFLASATSSRSLFQSTNPQDIVTRTLDTLFSHNN